MKYSYDDYLENLCTREKYRAQFNPPTLEIGKVYVQAPGTWHERHYIILTIDNNVAFAKCIFNAISEKFIGDHEMFNVNDGWRYNDSRELYRLVKKAEK